MGASLTIQGSGFGDDIANTKVMFNRTLATIVSVSPTIVVVEVPPGAGSGRITISSPPGSDASSEDFLVPRFPLTVSDVAFIDRIAQGETKSVTLGTPNSVSLLAFDGAAGQRISIGVTRLSFGAATGLVEVSLHGSFGRQLTSRLVGVPGERLDLDPLLDAGSYTVAIDPGQ